MSSSREDRSTILSGPEQDANLSGTRAARPGATDSTPAGLSTTSADASSLSNAVKGSLDSVADQTTSSRSLTDQLPSTQSLTQQLPSAQSITEQLPSAQTAADAVRSGASSLVAGISSLASGLNNAVAQNATFAQGSTQARDVDDLHVPGAFEEATTDGEDKVAVRNAVQSAQESIPSVESVKRSLPDTEGTTDQLSGNTSTGSSTNQGQSVSEQAQNALQSAYAALPSVESVKQAVIRGPSDQIPGNSSTGSFSNQAQDLSELAQVSARSAQTQIQQGVKSLQQSLSNTGSTTGPSSSNQPSELSEAIPSRLVHDQDDRPLPEDLSASESTRIHDDGLAHIKSKLESKDAATINTVGVNSTTSQLAGQVPLEPRGIPQIVSDSQRQAGGAAPLDEVPVSSTGPTNTTADSSVPDVVAESQQKAGVSPEASSNPEAVLEKKQVEQELKREVPEQSSATGTGASAGIGEALTGGMAAIGTAAAGAATYAREKTHETTGTDPVSLLPESAQNAVDPQTGTSRQIKSHDLSSVPPVVQESQRLAGIGPEAAANPVAVQDKKEVEQELQSAIAPAPSTSSGNTLSGTIGGNLADAATSASTFAREKTNELAENVLPRSTQSSIGRTSNTFGTESSVGQSGLDSSASITKGNLTGGLLYPHLTGTDQSENDRLSQGGIHNGVVGAGSGGPSGLPEHGTASSLTYGSHRTGSGNTTDADVSHISSVLQDVDLSAGVKNGVVGTGSGQQ